MVIVDGLQAIVTSLSQNATGHLIQSRIFASQNLNKIAENYATRASKEQIYIVKCIDRIIELGGDVKNEDKTEELVYKDAIEYLHYDLQVSKDALEWLKELIDEAKDEARDDSLTLNLLSDYYLAEGNEMHWTEQQLDLIEMIGRQNWLAKQI